MMVVFSDDMSAPFRNLGVPNTQSATRHAGNCYYLKIIFMHSTRVPMERPDGTSEFSNSDE